MCRTGGYCAVSCLNTAHRLRRLQLCLVYSVIQGVIPFTYGVLYYMRISLAHNILSTSTFVNDNHASAQKKCICLHVFEFDKNGPVHMDG